MVSQLLYLRLARHNNLGKSKTVLEILIFVLIKIIKHDHLQFFERPNLHTHLIRYMVSVIIYHFLVNQNILIILLWMMLVEFQAQLY